MIPRASARVARPQCWRAPSACNARSKSTVAIKPFAYVRPGLYTVRTHSAEWSEQDRKSTWPASSIPLMDTPLTRRPAPEVKVAAFYRSMSCHENFRAVQFLLVSLDPDGMLKGAAPALLAEPSAEERQRVSTPAGLRAVMSGLYSEIDAAAAEAHVAEERAIDGGLVDHAVPLPADLRESLQRDAARGLLLRLLKIVRSICVASARVLETLSPTAREGFRRMLDELSKAGTAPPGRGGHDSDDDDPALTPEQLRDFPHMESYEALKLGHLAHLDRSDTGIPHKRLPMPLHAGAPTRELADAARLLDENTSIDAEGKAYMLGQMADMMSGGPKAMQVFKAVEAENKAWFEPQPKWGSYDPKLVELQDRFLDAARGVGAYSALAGTPASEQRVPPTSIGDDDIDPTHATPLTAREEVAAGMRIFDMRAQAESDRAVASVTEALERAMGLAPKLARALQHESAAKQKAAAAAAGPRTFFDRHAAGEQLWTPAKPPLGGHRVIVEPNRRVAAATAAAADSKKGKKKK